MTENERRIIRSCISNGFEFISRSFDSGNITIKIGDELFDFDKLCELADEVEEALDKQTPKKPILWSDGYADDVLMVECPACGRELDYESREHHCVCGQKIDWTWADDE